MLRRFRCVQRIFFFKQAVDGSILLFPNTVLPWSYRNTCTNSTKLPRPRRRPSAKIESNQSADRSQLPQHRSQLQPRSPLSGPPSVVMLGRSHMWREKAGQTRHSRRKVGSQLSPHMLYRQGKTRLPRYSVVGPWTGGFHEHF